MVAAKQLSIVPKKEIPGCAGWKEGRIIEFPTRGEFSEKLLDDSRRHSWWVEGVLFMCPAGAWAPKTYSHEPSPGRQKAPSSQGSDPTCLNVFHPAKHPMVDVYIQDPIPGIYIDLM